MKIVKKVELSQNDKTFIEQLKELSMFVKTGTVFECEEINCKDCPFCIKDGEISHNCAVGHLLIKMDYFIKLTEEI